MDASPDASGQVMKQLVRGHISGVFRRDHFQ